MDRVRSYSFVREHPLRQLRPFELETQVRRVKAFLRSHGSSTTIVRFVYMAFSYETSAQEQQTVEEFFDLMELNSADRFALLRDSGAPIKTTDPLGPVYSWTDALRFMREFVFVYDPAFILRIDVQW